MSKRIETKPMKDVDDQADRLDQLRRFALGSAVCRGHAGARQKLDERSRAGWRRDRSARVPVADVEAILDEFGLTADYRDRLAGPELNGPRTVK